MALIGIAFGVGFTFGPLIAYFGLALFDQQPWGVGALASGAVARRAARRHRDLQGDAQPGQQGGQGVLQPRADGRGAEDADRRPLVLIYFLAIFAFAQFEATLALLTEVGVRHDGRGQLPGVRHVGAVLMFAGGLYRPLAKKRSEQKLLTIGVGADDPRPRGAGVVVASRATPDPGPAPAWLKPLFYLAMSVAVIGFAFVNPSVSALVSKRADPARQGEVLGVNQSFASLGRILGPFLGSVLFQAGASHTLPYLAAVGLLLVVVALLPRVKTELTTETQRSQRRRLNSIVHRFLCVSVSLW